MMIFVNLAEKSGLTRESYWSFIKLLAPFAPHLTEEIWQAENHQTSIHLESYPVADNELAKDTKVELGVQINGKMRGTITTAPEATEAEVVELALSEPSLGKYVSKDTLTKVIYVPGRILNLLVKSQD